MIDQLLGETTVTDVVEVFALESGVEADAS